MSHARQSGPVRGLGLRRRHALASCGGFHDTVLLGFATVGFVQHAWLRGLVCAAAYAPATSCFGFRDIALLEFRHCGLCPSMNITPVKLCVDARVSAICWLGFLGCCALQSDHAGSGRARDDVTSDAGSQGEQSAATSQPAPAPDKKGADVSAEAPASGGAPSSERTSGADCMNGGCPCDEPEAVRDCWTGPPHARHVGQCHDGTQRCVAEGQEFATWSACEGQQLDCGQPDEQECGCVPGVVIGCDEDCSAAIFCSPTGRKTCLPDGTWGPCRETNPNAISVDASRIIAEFGDSNALCSALAANVATPIINFEGLTVPCMNVYFGCCTTAMQGAFNGDCSAAFTCGHPPQSPD